MSDPYRNNALMNPYFALFPRISSNVVFSRKTVWFFAVFVNIPIMYLLSPISLALASRIKLRFNSGEQRKVMFSLATPNTCQKFSFYQYLIQER